MHALVWRALAALSDIIVAWWSPRDPSDLRPDLMCSQLTGSKERAACTSCSACSAQRGRKTSDLVTCLSSSRRPMSLHHPTPDVGEWACTSVCTARSRVVTAPLMTRMGDAIWVHNWIIGGRGGGEVRRGTSSSRIGLSKGHDHRIIVRVWHTHTGYLVPPIVLWRSASLLSDGRTA